MKLLKKPWIKLLIVIFLLAAILFVLRLSHIDFSKISEAEFKNLVESLGLWGPIIYIIAYIVRPLILFPAGVLSVPVRHLVTEHATHTALFERPC
mgnify:CR=1 FL=1